MQGAVPRSPFCGSGPLLLASKSRLNPFGVNPDPEVIITNSLSASTPVPLQASKNMLTSRGHSSPGLTVPGRAGVVIMGCEFTKVPPGAAGLVLLLYQSIIASSFNPVTWACSAIFVPPQISQLDELVTGCVIV